MHYFVNGGGGAYLSFGTALQWPATRRPPQWAFYPDRRGRDAEDRGADAVVETARLVVDDHFDAWPFSAEWLSALFDYNVAPFFQSFFEVRVEPSAPGPPAALRRPWAAAVARPRALARLRRGTGRDDFGEWVVPMR